MKQNSSLYNIDVLSRMHKVLTEYKQVT